MLIGVLSDTHDQAEALTQSVEIFNSKNVELVIHCGDWVSPFMPDFCKGLKCKIVSVWGNNEGDKYRFMKRSQQHEWDIEFHDKCFESEIDGKKVVAYHGDNKTLLEALVASQRYDAIFTGHTHKWVVEQKGKTLVVNPGTTSGQIDSQAGQARTIAIYDTLSNQAEIIQL